MSTPAVNVRSISPAKFYLVRTGESSAHGGNIKEFDPLQATIHNSVTVSFSMLPDLENCCALGLPVKMGESIDVARSAERLATEVVLVR